MKGNMYKFTAVLTQLALLALLTACSTTPRVDFDFDTSNDFSDYKTFSWLADPLGEVVGNMPVADELNQRISDTLLTQFEQKGFSYTETQDEADFLISYTFGARDDLLLNQIPTSIYENSEEWLWGKEYHSYMLGLDDEEADIEYARGVFALDIFDSKSRRPVWHSKVQKVLENDESPPSADEVKQIVTLALQNYPPNF